MFSVSRWRVICLLLFAAMSGAAHAEVIFDNGETISFAGVLSDGVLGLTADNFTLEEGANTITDIHWWGFYGELVKDVPTDNFTVYIFADDSGKPGAAPLHTFTGSVDVTSNGTTNFGFPEYEYVMNIDPLELTAGTTYWLAIANDVGGDTKGQLEITPFWFWSFSQVFVGDAHAKAPTAWIDLNAEMAFQLTNDGVVPEPATMTLLGAGLVGLALRRRFLRTK